MPQRSSSSRLSQMKSSLKLAQGSMTIIKERSQTLQQQYEESKDYSFHDEYVLGDCLGEGQHAAVFKCYPRIKPRDDRECTPKLSKQLLSGLDY